MYIELYNYIEGDESCEKGEYLGYVSLEEDDVYIDIDDDEIMGKLDELFSEPLRYSKSLIEPEKEVEPYTEEFFRIIPAFLVDYEIRGILKEDEENNYQRSISLDDDEVDNDDNSIDMMSVEEIEDEEYELDEESEIIIK